MKFIFTLKGEKIFVDDEDYERLRIYSWHISTRGYAMRFPYENGHRIGIMMHRFILGIDRGDHRIIDHVNGNKIDNRRCNLRICTKAQNGYNQKAQRTNTTGYKGVMRHKQTGRYIAQIGHEGKKIHLGSFSTAAEAYAAFCEAAQQLHGEFANFGCPAIDAALQSHPKGDQ